MRGRSFALRALVWAAAALVFGGLIALLAEILIRGLPHCKLSMLQWEYTSENRSLLPALINTLTMVALTLLIAAPVGIGAAIYLTEYAKRGSRFVRLVGIAAETLAGIPSIVYGLFGYLLFVLTCGLGRSMLSGALTLAVMVLPTLLRTSEEAIRAVPDRYREGSFGLGAGRLRTVFRIVLPAAAQGISSGLVLAIGRIVGETAALIYTAGTVTGVADGLLGSGRTLAVHLYALLNEGLYLEEAYATAVALLLLVVGINALAAAIAKRLARGSNGKHRH